MKILCESGIVDSRQMENGRIIRLAKKGAVLH